MANKLKVMTILGTRPEIIRLAETIKACDKYFDHILVHTGQNYDYELNQIFFEELGLRAPDYSFTEKSHCIVNTQEIGNLIKKRRQSLKVNQQELSDLAGIGINTLVAIERGQGNPKLETLQSVLDTLGLQIDICLKEIPTPSIDTSEGVEG